MSLADRLGALSRESKGDSKKEVLFQTAPGEQWVQKSVLLQREEKGYGFRLAGNGPTQVQSVRENSPAARAGIAPYDKISKVNGTLVTAMKHEEVVKLIDSNSHVQLTILRKVSSGPVSSPISASVPQAVVQQAGRVSEPLAADGDRARDFQQMKLTTLITMYDQALAEYDRIRSEVLRYPNNENWNVKLIDSTKVLDRLKQQIDDMRGYGDVSTSPQKMSNLMPPSSGSGMKRQASGGSGAVTVEDRDVYQQKQLPTGPKHQKTLSLPETMVITSPDGREDSAAVLRSQSDRKKVSVDYPAVSPSIAESDRELSLRDRSQGAFSMGDERYEENSSPERNYSGYDDQPDESQPATAGVNRNAPIFVQPQEVQIISVEEEECAPEEQNLHENRNSWAGFPVSQGEQGPFASLSQLFNRPAHLSVFLHYLFCNSDPVPLLFRLVIDSYVRGNSKDMKRWAYEIFSTFVAEDSPLRVALQPFVVRAIDEILLYKSDKDDVMKSVFEQARIHIERDIRELLTDFRNKSVMGLDNLYGAHELSKLTSSDRQEELNVAQKFLWQNFERLNDMQKTDHDVALLWSLATVIKEMGLVNTVPNASLLERTPSFVCKDKKFKLGRTSRKTVSLLDHNFQQMQYFSYTPCMCCQKILWGIGNQGFQCGNCEANIHFDCVLKLGEKCGGKGKKRDTKRLSVIPKIQRKPGGSSPSGATVNYSQSVKESMLHGYDDDQDDARTKRQLHYDSSDILEEDVVISDDDISRMGASSISLPAQSDLIRSVSAASDLSRSTISSGYESVVSLRSFEDDRDLEIEADMPSLESVLGKDVVKKLKPKEKKRQEVINELFYTEANHVRNLRVLQKVFYQPMSSLPKYPDRLFETIFPNLYDVHRVHANLSNSFKERRKENPIIGNVGDLLLAAVDGESGVNFRNIMAKFCGNQSHAGNLLRQRQRNDAKFAQFLQECNSNPLCRRLELKDLLPTIMQRLTKYPLLIENLLKYSQADTEEYKNLQKALECSKGILAHVNKEVRECENRQRLLDIHSQLDTSNMPKEYRTFDMRKNTLIHSGSLVWKINAQKQIEVYVLLLDNQIVILERKENRYVLRQQNVAIGSDQYLYNPLVELTGLLIKTNAGDAKAFFLIKIALANKEDPAQKKRSQIYELVASSKDEHKTWTKNIEAAVKAAESCAKNPPAVVPSSVRVEPVTTPSVPPETEVVETPVRTTADDEDTYRHEESDVDRRLENSKSSSSSSTSLEMAHAETYEVEPQLIHPSEVVVKDHLIVSDNFMAAQSCLSLTDKIQRENENIIRSLRLKRKLVSEMLGVPDTNFQTAGVDNSIEPLMCLFEDINQLVEMCSKARIYSSPNTLNSDHYEGNASAALSSSDNTSEHRYIELDYDALTNIVEHFNTHISHLIDKEESAVISQANNESKPVVLTPISQPSYDSSVASEPKNTDFNSCTSNRMSVVDRPLDEELLVEPSRAEIRLKINKQHKHLLTESSSSSTRVEISRRQRDSYLTAVELSPEPEALLFNKKIENSGLTNSQPSTLKEWSPFIQTNQYSVVHETNIDEQLEHVTMGTMLETEVPKELLTFELDSAANTFVTAHDDDIPYEDLEGSEV